MQTFVDALRAIGDLGSGTLPDRHEPQLIEDYKRTARGGKTAGCHRPHRAALPYTDQHGNQQFATICVECDAGYLIPAVARKVADG